MIHFSVTFFHHLSLTSHVTRIVLKTTIWMAMFLGHMICRRFARRSSGGLWWGWLGTGGLLGWLLGEGVPLSRPSVTRAPCLLHHHPGHPGICPLLRRAGEKRNRFSISCKSNKEMGTRLKRAWIEVIWSRGDQPAPAAPGRPGSPGLYLGQPL